jgi:tRNA(His) 5'-end guanylyltransferase
MDFLRVIIHNTFTRLTILYNLLADGNHFGYLSRENQIEELRLNILIVQTLKQMLFEKAGVGYHDYPEIQQRYIQCMEAMDRYHQSLHTIS